jgi:hypothetical protein
MRISGYYTAAAGYLVSQSDGRGTGSPLGTPVNVAGPAGSDAGYGRRDHAFKQDTEVHFLGETKLDNGLIVGVHFEFEGQTQGGDQVDETWMYFKGNWGELRFGDEDDVARLKTYIAPTVGGNIFGLNEAFISFTNNPVGTLSTQGTNENDSTKILYFTPSIAGFQAAFSYAPSATQDRRNNGYGGNGAGSTPTTNPGNTTTCGGASETRHACGDQAWSVAATYDAKFGGVTLGVGAGYSAASNNATTPGYNANLEAMRASALLGFGPFQVGGGWMKGRNWNGNGLNVSQYDLGVKYTIGPFEVALEGMYGEFDNCATGSVAAGATPGTAACGVKAKPTLTQGLLSVGYNLGPGIWVAAAVQYDSYWHEKFVNTAAGGGLRNGAAGPGLGGVSGLNGARDYQSTALMVGTRINF